MWCFIKTFLTPLTKYLWWVCSGIAFAITGIRKAAKLKTLVPEHWESINCGGLCMNWHDIAVPVPRAALTAEISRAVWGLHHHCHQWATLFMFSSHSSGEQERSHAKQHHLAAQWRNTLDTCSEELCHPHPVCEPKGWAWWHSSPWWEGARIYVANPVE